jgi:hypothetical protein
MQAGTELGFPVFDLTAALQAAGGGYHDPVGHWNAIGDRVAAEEVGRFLRDEGWLGACSAR